MPNLDSLFQNIYFHYYEVILILFYLAATVEFTILALIRKHDWKEALCSASQLSIKLFLIFIIPKKLYHVLLYYFSDQIPNYQRPNNFFYFVILLITVDFAYYVWHRTAHKVNFLWVTHCVHHSFNTMNLWNGSRTSIVERFSTAPLFFTPISLLGFTSTNLSKAVVIVMTYQLWIHCSWIPKIKVLDYFLNTPSNHRVHHQLKYLKQGKNFGGILIIFDRLFGTYQEEIPNEDHTYGLFDQQRTYNIINVEFREIFRLGKNIVKSKSFINTFNYLFNFPGWTPGKIKQFIQK